MKNIIFFITHKTLSIEHARATLFSISNQILFDKKFDILYIYNSHQEELSNEIIIELCLEFNLDKFFDLIKIFDYNPLTHKSLGADIFSIYNYVKENYSIEDRVLFLKSDCVLSKNYFNDILNLNKEKYIYFVAPFICAKERISDKEIFEYANRNKYKQSDDITFFVEDQTNNIINSDFNNRSGINVTDIDIKFTSCYVITDFSCHYISIGLMHKMIIEFQSWGGVKFYNLVPYFIGTSNSFVIHKYHDIISDNRSTDREGPVKLWLTS